MVLTAWRLAKAGRQRVQCVVSERGGRWRVIVQEGPHITFSERCAWMTRRWRARTTSGTC